ncbi:alcohol dehydrogenase catalytic domain-containing protein, partial [uncultured Pseudoalteromonas sp.]|uniref:alcohol dehydrogenase catalytic domain-containing protein n=1 Tax=uncultured Pseudoalteromonas sp. TaxID=114053 RepID=UPI0025896249
MTTSVKSVVINKDDQGYRAEYTDFPVENIHQHEVNIDVDYSTLNYKDALAITGKGPVVRTFPMIPGIDLAGTVTESKSDEFKVGDKVLLNGFGVGEKYLGGLSEKASMNADWLIPLPANLTPKQAMQIGTAGYTAMLSIIALEKQGITPQSGEILVTGANGGVGSFAIYLLNKLGFDVVAT